MTLSGAPHDKSHEEEVRGRSKVKIHGDRPMRESRLWRKRTVFRLERKESRETQEQRERGREFQMVGAAKQNDVRPRASLISGITRRCLSIDLSSLVDT